MFFRGKVLFVLASSIAVVACSSGNGGGGGGTGGTGGSGLVDGGADTSLGCANVAADFAPSGVNPKGVWSYGWTTTLGSTFNILTMFQPATTTTDPGNNSLCYWQSQVSSLGPPTVGFNPAPAVIHGGVDSFYPNGTYTVQPGQLIEHPGPTGEYAVARWTSPGAGSFRVQVTFQGVAGYLATPVTTTDVHILHNGSDVASGFLNVNGSGNSFSATPTVSVVAGDTIDFAVGYGNGMYNYDSTGLDATVRRI